MKKLLVSAVIVTAFLSGGFGVFLSPLLYTLTPLQRYYLAPYLLSSWKAEQSGAATKVRWIWKLQPDPGTPKREARKGQPQYRYELAKEDDLVSVPAHELLWKGDRLPFSMSAKAQAEGWLAVTRLQPVEVSSGQLATGLRVNFYDGEPVWQFFVQPGSFLLLGLLLLWIVRWERAAYYRRNPWSSTPFWQHLARKIIHAGSRFQRRMGRRMSSISAPSSQPPGGIEPAPPKKPPAPVRPTPVAAATVSKPASQPETVPAVPSKSPVQPTLWDESQGLE